MTGRCLIRGARQDECALLSDLAFRSKASWGYGEQFMEDCRDELTISGGGTQIGSVASGSIPGRRLPLIETRS